MQSLHAAQKRLVAYLDVGSLRTIGDPGPGPSVHIVTKS